MKSNKRWINNTIAAAAECDVKMPWERGARRQAMIARRTENVQPKSSVTLAPMPGWMTEAISA